jgi:hypothetical protein
VVPFDEMSEPTANIADVVLSCVGVWVLFFFAFGGRPFCPFFFYWEVFCVCLTPSLWGLFSGGPGGWRGVWGCRACEPTKCHAVKVVRVCEK